MGIRVCVCALYNVQLKLLAVMIHASLAGCKVLRCRNAIFFFYFFFRCAGNRQRKNTLSLHCINKMSYYGGDRDRGDRDRTDRGTERTSSDRAGGDRGGGDRGRPNPCRLYVGMFTSFFLRFTFINL